MKDPNGLVTTLSYSPRGWLKTRQVGTALTSYDYDAVGQLKKVTLADGSWIGYDYDPAHRLTDIYDQTGNRITYTLDAAGNRTREDVKDPAGALARTHTRVYDALSRVQNLIQPQ
jgi:YD repeat-containing protein